MSVSAAIAATEVITRCGILSPRQDPEKALDLASAVTTHLDAVGTAARQAGSLAAQLVNILFQVCLPPSRLRAPVSLADCAISRRTVMNNPGCHPLHSIQIPATRFLHGSYR
jgi:hypothetical protein